MSLEDHRVNVNEMRAWVAGRLHQDGDVALAVKAARIGGYFCQVRNNAIR